jgi:hypothetical protein
VNIALWVAASLLALAFAIAGIRKTVRSKADLQPQMAWVEHTSAGAVKALGIVEVAGAVGLIAPALTGIATVLTPVAAVGCAVTMVGAFVVNLRHPQFSHLASNVVLFALAAFVAWGRFGPYAFS